jgi:hypothetical protein
MERGIETKTRAGLPRQKTAGAGGRSPKRSNRSVPRSSGRRQRIGGSVRHRLEFNFNFNLYYRHLLVYRLTLMSPYIVKHRIRIIILWIRSRFEVIPTYVFLRARRRYITF